jgi:hypothetical protein
MVPVTQLKHVSVAKFLFFSRWEGEKLKEYVGWIDFSSFGQWTGAVLCSQCKGSGVNSVDLFNGQFKAGDSCWLCG